MTLNASQESNVGATSACPPVFWVRIGAFSFDYVLLTFPLFVLAIFCFHWVQSLGQSGRLLGVCLAIPYFTIANSHLTGGQSFGKQLFNIMVVDQAGLALSLVKSFLRCLVLLVPYFMNGLWFPTAPDTARWVLILMNMFLSLITVGALSGICYLFIFNRGTRQSLHDLAVGSFVLRDGTTPHHRSTPHLHLQISTVLLLLSFVWPLNRLAHDKNEQAIALQQQLQQLRASVIAQTGISHLGVSTSWFRIISMSGSDKRETFLAVNAQMALGYSDKTEEIKAIVKAVLMAQPGLCGQHLLRINILSGVDLGLISSTNATTETYDADTWKTKIS